MTAPAVRIERVMGRAYKLTFAGADNTIAISLDRDDLDQLHAATAAHCNGNDCQCFQAGIEEGKYQQKEAHP